MVVACVASAMCLLAVGFTRELAATASMGARAQLAADAAALAAAAEAAPYGSGKPRVEAARFARRNGARLISCTCEPGATAVEVAVAVEDVIGRARAVLDVDLLAPDRVMFTHDGLNPNLAAAVEQLVAAAKGAVWVVSGYRSSADQAQLWASALERYGSREAADDWVAPPGTSMHESGLAVDLGGDLDQALKLIHEMRLPLYRPLSNEPWHFELAGARP
jgi:hypothetical protein